MRDAIDDLGPIEWLRELFEDASAESLFRWVMVSWIVAVLALIALDRVGSALAGRSRPLSQNPPVRARTWRWRRLDPPEQYSLLPGRTVISAGSPAPTRSIPLARSTVEADDGTEDAILMLEAGPVPNEHYWARMADPARPLFGLENTDRLALGLAPERYNPVTDHIESLTRDPETGEMAWPETGSPSRCVLSLEDEATEDPEGAES